jgi:biotin carboxyl carrier protein
MKKTIRFQFEGDTYTVDVEKKGNDITVEKEGEIFRVTLLPEERAQTVPAAPAPAAAPAAAAAPRPAPRPAPATPAAAAPAAGALLAPMTGVIKEVRVSDGQQVTAGQVVLIMEAMKMDIDVQAPAAGVISDVSVRQGDNVSANQLLLNIQ